MPPKEIYEPKGSQRAFAAFGVEQYFTNNSRLSNKQRRMLDLAMRLAESSEVSQRHGAIVAKGGRVLSVGVNKWRNRDMVITCNEYDPNLTVHAEIDALSRVKDPHGAVLYVARVGKDGAERFSRPCDRCAAALAEAGVKQVVYTMGAIVD